MRKVTFLAIASTVLATAPALAQSRYDQTTSQYNYNQAPFSASSPRQSGQSASQYGAGQYGQTTSPMSRSGGQSSQYDTSQSYSQSQQTSAAQTGDIATERDVVSAVQQRLQQQGYQVGSTNGQINSETRNSVLNYQSRHGLRPTGQIDLSTLASMGIGVNVASIGRTGAQAAQSGGATSLGQTAQGSVITVEPQTAQTPTVDRFPMQGRDSASGIPGTEDLRDQGKNPETYRSGARYPTENPPGVLDPQEVAPSQRYTTTP